MQRFHSNERRKNMTEVLYEISKEEYEKAQEKSAYAIISDSIKMGYGCYGAAVYEIEGKYYLRYEKGSSCD